jgi:hypothetical protein
MMAMHCTRKLALEKILGLHYRGFEILTLVFTRPCELSPSKNWQFSRWVEKVRLGAVQPLRSVQRLTPVQHSRGQIYFGFEVDEKLLPFAIEEFGDQCWVYGSDIPHGDRLYGAVDVFLKHDDISEESKRKLLFDNAGRFYGL